MRVLFPRMIVFTVCFVFRIIELHAQTPFVWYDGQVRHEIHLQRDLVADFAPGDSTRAPRPPDDSVSEKKEGARKGEGPFLQDGRGGVRIFKRGDEDSDRFADRKTAPSQSPVFADTAAGTGLRALPGGIVVTFSESMSEAAVRAWAAENGLAFDRLLHVTTVTMAAFKTGAGLVALEVANRVRELAGVKSAQPNWWTEKSKNNGMASELTATDLAKAKKSRAEQSRQMRDLRRKN